MVLARVLAHRINIGRGEHGQIEEAPWPDCSTECVAIKIVVNNNNEILCDIEHYVPSTVKSILTYRTFLIFQ